jgi:hypothetical protein
VAPLADSDLAEFDAIIAAANDTTLIDQAEFYLARARAHIRRLERALARYRGF